MDIYLLINPDRKKSIKELERLSKDKNQSQIFIETPYRNEKMFDDLKASLTPNTQFMYCMLILLYHQNILKLYQ